MKKLKKQKNDWPFNATSTLIIMGMIVGAVVYVGDLRSDLSALEAKHEAFGRKIWAAAEKSTTFTDFKIELGKVMSAEKVLHIMKNAK